MKTEKTVVASTFGLAAIISLATLLTRLPAHWAKGSFDYHWPLSTDVAGVILTIGAGIIFLMAIKAYKDQLRRAYIAITFSVVLLALSTAQLPIFDSYNLWSSPWVTDGYIIAPFMASCLIGYFGVRRLAKLVGAKSIYTNVILVLVGTFVVSFIPVILPHTSNMKTTKLDYEISNVLSAWLALLYFSMLWLAVRVSRHIGEHYKTAMLALAMALTMGTTILMLVLINSIIINDTHSFLYKVVNLLTLVAGLAWLRAGYLFSRTKEY